jgi:hypothetical protein
MSEESAVGRIRGKCVWWLSGQCKGGARCNCLPWPRWQPETDLVPEPHLIPDRPPAGTDEAPADGR